MRFQLRQIWVRKISQGIREAEVVSVSDGNWRATLQFIDSEETVEVEWRTLIDEGIWSLDR